MEARSHANRPAAGLPLARKASDRAPLALSDARLPLPVRDSPTDRLLSTQVIHHGARTMIRAPIREVHRVLREPAPRRISWVVDSEGVERETEPLMAPSARSVVGSRLR